MIIAVSGTPGTGKTTVARLLAKRLGFRLIGLNELAREKGLFSGHDEERECDIVDMGKLRKELDKVRERDMVIESHYAHDMKSDVLFLLAARPDELRKRYAGKGWPGKKAEENVLAEVMGVCKSEALDNGKTFHEIDTTGKDPGKVVDEMLRIIGKYK